MENFDNTQVTGNTVEGVATLTQPSAQDVSANAETAQETPVGQKYVTEEAFEQKLAEAIRRVKQSDKDRMSLIDKKLEAIKSRLESGGQQLSPQQVNALREQITEEVGDATDVKQEKPQASGISAEMQAQADFVYAQLDETFADVGTSVTPNDPEWVQIKEVLDSPKGSIPKLIRVAGKAAEAKAERIATQKNTAAARAVSGGDAQQTSGDAMPVNISTNELFSRAHRK